MITNQKGQTSIEALLALPLLVLFLSLVFVIFASARSYFWAQYQLHEAVICLQDQSASKCKKAFSKKIKDHLTFCEIQNLQIYRSAKSDVGKMIITFRFLKSLHLEIEKRVHHE